MEKNNTHRIPKLRFPGFEDEWTDKIFGSLFKERNEYPTEAFPLYSLTIEKGVTPKTERYERKFLVKSEDEAYKLVYPNDFVYNPMNLRFGALARHKGQNKVLVSKYYNIFYANDNANPEFLETYLTRNKMIQYYNRMATGSLEEKKRVHYTDFIKFEKPFPSLPEQQKIASFLSAIGRWIENLREEKEAFLEYEKGIMQKIYGQEIRFKDDNGRDFPAWQEKQLGDIFRKNQDRNADNSEKQVLTNSAVEGIVNQQDYFNKDIANENNLTNYFIVDTDDFIYNPRISKSAPVGPFKRNKLHKGIMSPLYTVLKPKKGNLIFLEKYFETRYWHRYMYKIANYGARHDRMNIIQSDFMKMPIPFPSLPEQQKIADFLVSIEKVIKQKEKLVAEAEEWKKGLMQNLFI